MAASSFNYSKWDNIELSDDESDLHPNIDKDSWFRMKHRSRLEREEREDDEIKQYDKLNTENSSRLKVIHARIKGLESGKFEDEAELDDIDALKGESAELEEMISTRMKRIHDIKERRKWNIDNICQVTEEKTVVNKSTPNSLKAEDFVPNGKTDEAIKKNEEMKKSADAASTTTTSAPSSSSSSSSSSSPSTVFKAQNTAATGTTSKPAVVGPSEVNSIGNKDRDSMISYNDFVLTHEDLLEKYSEIADIESSKDFLFRHCDILLHEHSQSYMLLSSLEDEMNGKKKRMKLVCRQSQILSHITELGQSMKLDPRDVVLPFFKRISEPEHYKAFASAVDDFIQKIAKRAIEKRKEMDKEREENNQEGSVLGPGGLDPFEVLKVLPVALREAFESQSIEKLHEVIGSMTPVDAKKYMKMCVDAGLWVASNNIFDDEGEDVDEDDEIDAVEDTNVNK